MMPNDSGVVIAAAIAGLMIQFLTLALRFLQYRRQVVSESKKRLLEEQSANDI